MMKVDPLHGKINTRTIAKLATLYHSFANLCFGFVIYVHVLVITVYSYCFIKSNPAWCGH